jgi:hypothetical protein
LCEGVSSDVEGTALAIELDDLPMGSYIVLSMMSDRGTNYQAQSVVDVGPGRFTAAIVSVSKVPAH